MVKKIVASCPEDKSEMKSKVLHICTFSVFTYSASRSSVGEVLVRDSCNLWKSGKGCYDQIQSDFIFNRAAHIHQSGVQVFDVLVDVAVVLQEMLRRLGHLLPLGLNALCLCVEVEAKILVYGR